MIDIYKESGTYNAFQEFFYTKGMRRVIENRQRLSKLDGLVGVYQEDGITALELSELTNLIASIHCIEDFDYRYNKGYLVVELKFVSGNASVFSLEILV